MPGESSRDDFTAAIAELEASGDTGREPTDIVDTDPLEQAADKPPADKPAADKQRDPAGRYAPKTAAKDPAAADQKPADEETPDSKTAVQDPSKVVDPGAAKPTADKAPASWKPEEREGWETMTPHHKAAVLRREREVDETLRLSADARRWHQEFSRVAAPYEMIFRTENTDPIRAADHLFRTAALLRTAPPAQKAGLVADMIMDFSIDLESLDSSIAERMRGGKGKTSATDPILAAIDEKLKPVTAFLDQNRQSQQSLQQQAQQEAERTWTEFSSANEFAEDLRQDIADLLELASRRGVALSLQDAYKRAMLAHPTISQIVDRRKQATDPAQQSAAARRAAQASASLSQHGGAPSQDGDDEGDGSVASDLRASIRKLSRSQGR